MSDKDEDNLKYKTERLRFRNQQLIFVGIILSAVSWLLAITYTESGDVKLSSVAQTIGIGPKLNIEEFTTTTHESYIEVAYKVTTTRNRRLPNFAIPVAVDKTDSYWVPGKKLVHILKNSEPTSGTLRLDPLKSFPFVVTFYTPISGDNQGFIESIHGKHRSEISFPEYSLVTKSCLVEIDGTVSGC